MTKVWPIDNLDCAACAAKMEDALGNVAGVESVRVNFLAGTLTLSAPEEAFDRVLADVIAKAAKVEPDAVIRVEGVSHAHHHEHAEHEHHHDHAEHEHHHDHAEHEHHHDHEHHHHDGACCDCCDHDHEHSEPETPLDLTSPVARGSVRRVYPIDGLDCAACAAKLEHAMSKVDGVENVRISFMQKQLALVCAENRVQEITAALQAVCERVEPEAVIRLEETPHAARSAAEKKEKEQPVLLYRVAAAIVLMVAGLLLKPAWLSVALFLLSYLIAGYDVLLKAIRNIAHGQIFDENFLMTVASVGAMVMGEFPEAIAVMSLYQIGEWFQDRAVEKSRASIASLMDIRPDYANLLRDGQETRVDPNQVAVGDLIVVKPGEKVPLDGVIVSGSTSLNTVALTGESLPRDAEENDTVASGCVNLSGVITVRVTSLFGDSTVAKILSLVETSGESKAKAEKFITRFARYYTPAVCAAALLLAVVPPLYLGGGWAKWVEQALSFLVISCPCALVISVPLTFFSGIGGASRKGVLVKGANCMETLSKLDTLAFDKTGTLTEGAFKVSAVHPLSGDPDELLEIAALAESYSGHPISKSLQSAYGKLIDRHRVADVEEIAGHGVKARVDGHEVYAGNAKLMRSIALEVKPCHLPGTLVYVAMDGQLLGHIVISDVIKPTASQAIRDLKAIGVRRLVMLTGDRKNVAEDTAQKLGLTECRSELLPEDKVKAVEALLGGDHRVGFVGDGINDAPVLRRADLGIAMGAMGSDAAIEAADVVLMDDNPAKLPLAIRMARKTMGIVQQNIVFALGVKAVIMVLGFLGIANMWLAVFADVGVAMLAILNAMRAMK